MGKLFRTLARVFVRLAVPVVGVALVAVAIAWEAGWFHEKIAPGQMPYQYRSAEGRQVVPVTLLRRTEYVDAVGTVQPRNKTEIAAKVLATVVEVRVNASDVVHKGQLLVQLDDREIQAQLRELEAARLGVESDLRVRRLDFERYEKMYAERVVTKEEYDRVEGMYQVALARLKQTDEQIQRVRVMLSYTQITSPIDGIVAERLVDPGDLAAPGRPLLSLYNPKELELHASVRERLASKVKLGQKLPVYIESLDRTMEGTVREIVPQAEARSRSVLVKVALPPDQLEGLYRGMFGRLSIPLAEAEYVVVDADAVQQVGQLDLVDVVVELNGRKILKRRFVRTGQYFDGKVEILSGLKVGELVAKPK